MAKKTAEPVFPRWMYRHGTTDGRQVNNAGEEEAARSEEFVDVDEIEALSWNGGVPHMPKVEAPAPAEKKK